MLGRGFYIVLGLCVCAVGVSGWLFVSNAVSEKRSLQSETLSIATSAEDPQAGKSSGGKTAPTTAPAAEETAPADGEKLKIAIVTGAEGGFAAEEAEMAAKAGAKTVGLGPRILRCETAPLAVLASVMTLTGNLE